MTRGEFNGESDDSLEADLDRAWSEEIQTQVDRLNASWGVPQRGPRMGPATD